MRPDQKNRFTASAVFSLAELEAGKYPVELLIRQDLAHRISEEVQKKALEVIDSDFSKEFRMSVYVLSPSELHALIDAEVERRQLRMSPSLGTGFQVLS